VISIEQDSKVITYSPTDLSSHLACRHLTQLERARREGTLKINFFSDPRVEALKERGLQHEARYVEGLRAAGKSIVDLRQTRDASDTLRVMREGPDAIVQAPLSHGRLSGVVDVLLRTGTPSRVGSFSYEPVDTKLAKETRAGTLLQLCAYAELLGETQGSRPERVHVVTPLALETYGTAQFAAYYRLVRAQFYDAMSALPAPVSYPDPVSHCDVCRYHSHCEQRRRADDHPSYIAGIHSSHIQEFQSQGIETLTAIASCNGALPQAPRRGSRATYQSLGEQARLQVLSRGAAAPLVEYLPVQEGRGLNRLPTPCEGDIFLDFEGDPFVGESGLEYLTGFHVREGGKVIVQQRWALNAVDERAACEHFLDFVAAQMQRFPELHIYHFGSYEPATLKRLCARYQTRGDLLDGLLRGLRFIDLHTVVRETMRVGVERYGLKQLEALHGFVRVQDLEEASVCRRDVEIAIEFGDHAAITDELRQRVSKYNEEDCISAEALRNWLEQERERRVAAGHEITRPLLPPMEASPEVDERDARIEALRQALRDRLPRDAEVWSDEDRATELLASMLGYFRQEEKNAWWEHFRLRDLPVGEHLGERAMVAGLEYVETLPKEPRHRIERRRYRFPRQEMAMKAGDKAYFTKFEDPAGAESVGTSLSVVEVDKTSGTLVLGCGKFSPHAHPTAIFEEQVKAKLKPLEDSLLSLAEHVRDRGYAAHEGMGAPIALLLRKAPRTRDGATALRRSGENSVDAAKRLALALDHEVLPIQGPPGAGKTYTGARIILDLVSHGYTVGVTAVSHKVIDNLLLAVKDAAKSEGGQMPRLVHKDNGDPPDGVEYLTTSADARAAVRPGNVVGGTVWLWADEAACEVLDYLFVDEAGQMSLAHALAASRCAKNLVLLGDPQQLEQPQRGAHPDGADVAALVHLIGKGNATVSDDRGLFLDTTYRLHPSICSFTSEVYYENRLTSVAELARQRLGAGCEFAGAGLFLVEIAHSGNQASSAEEVDAVTRLVRTLTDGHTTWTNAKGRTAALGPNDVLVIAPYNAQVSALAEALEPFGVTRVGTVDRFQGQEAPVVIYSCTSSSATDAPRGMGFLYDPHRLNVATSRAQGVVIMVASPGLLEPETRTPDQMRWANGFCRYQELAKKIITTSSPIR
jgi:uncharacterized protein